LIFLPRNLTYFLKTEQCPYLLNCKWYDICVLYAWPFYLCLKSWHLDFDDDDHLWNLPQTRTFVFSQHIVLYKWHAGSSIFLCMQTSPFLSSVQHITILYHQFSTLPFSIISSAHYHFLSSVQHITFLYHQFSTLSSRFSSLLYWVKCKDKNKYSTSKSMDKLSTKLRDPHICEN
jgi:hypothetical protein